MFEKLRIKEHMEVAGSDGQHVGIVDKVEGDTIKLTKTDAADGQHHELPLDMVDRIEENRVWLTVPASAVPFKSANAAGSGPMGGM